MTPAEKMAQQKPPRKRRKSPRPKVPPSWNCTAREVRESLRLSMLDAATGCKLSVAAVYQIENGSDPMLTTARTIATFYGRTVEELWPTRK